MNSGDYLIPKEIYDELFSDYIELVQKEERLQQELEQLKKPINYYQYASKNLKDKNEQLKQKNTSLKERIETTKQFYMHELLKRENLKTPMKMSWESVEMFNILDGNK